MINQCVSDLYQEQLRRNTEQMFTKQLQPQKKNNKSKCMHIFRYIFCRRYAIKHLHHFKFPPFQQGIGE